MSSGGDFHKEGATMKRAFHSVPTPESPPLVEHGGGSPPQSEAHGKGSVGGAAPSTILIPNL